MALLEEMPRSAGAIARTEAKVFLLYRTRFFGLIQSRPRVGVLILDQLARLLSARLRSTSQRLVAQDYGTGQQSAWMKTSTDQRIFGLLAAAALLSAAYFVLSYVGEIAFLFFLGVVLAYLLNPLIVKLEARGYRRDRLVTGLYLSVFSFWRARHGFWCL